MDQGFDPVVAPAGELLRQSRDAAGTRVGYEYARGALVNPLTPSQRHAGQRDLRGNRQSEDYRRIVGGVLEGVNKGGDVESCKNHGVRGRLVAWI